LDKVPLLSTLQWLLTAASLVIAAVALLKARRAARRLERLSESYWELHYEAGQLRARVARLEGANAPAPEQDLPASPQGGRGSFVPLSSLKR